MQHTDRLYSRSERIHEQFRFDASVADVFNDMVTRSVPGYTLMLDVIGVCAEKYIRASSLCYDLGCSLGASTLAIRQNIQSENCRIIAVDNSPAMIERCQKVMARDKSPTSVDILEADISTLDFEPADFICMNLTLQFIREPMRQPLINRMSEALGNRGVLCLSEKLLFTEEEEASTLTDLHHQFKKHQGYSDLEIARKRQAIEDVLIPESLETHKNRLYNAGFSQVLTVFSCLNFCTLLALK